MLQPVIPQSAGRLRC